MKIDYYPKWLAFIMLLVLAYFLVNAGWLMINNLYTYLRTDQYFESRTATQLGIAIGSGLMTVLLFWLTKKDFEYVKHYDDEE